MRLHGFLPAVALAAFVGIEVVAVSSALAWPVAPGYVPPMPAQFDSRQEVTQVPMFGDQGTTAQMPLPSEAPQTAQVPESAQALPQQTPNGPSTFVAPGVEQDSSGHMERTP